MNVTEARTSLLGDLALGREQLLQQPFESTLRTGEHAVADEHVGVVAVLTWSGDRNVRLPSQSAERVLEEPLLTLEVLYASS